MTTKVKEQYIPKTFPEKCLLMGGGQFLNQFMVVNVLSVKDSPHPMIDKATETVPQATVEERGYSGIKTMNPYLLMYYLLPLDKRYADIPLDTYVSGFDGTVIGQYTKHIINMKKVRN